MGRPDGGRRGDWTGPPRGRYWRRGRGADAPPSRAWSSGHRSGTSPRPGPPAAGSLHGLRCDSCESRCQRPAIAQAALSSGGQPAVFDHRLAVAPSRGAWKSSRSSRHRGPLAHGEAVGRRLRAWLGPLDTHLRRRTRAPVASFGVHASTTKRRCHLDHYTEAIDAVTPRLACSLFRRSLTAGRRLDACLFPLSG